MNAILVGKDLRGAESGQEIILNGETYHLAFDMNAMCELEEKYGSFDAAMEILAKMEDEEIDSDGNKIPKKIMKDIRFILWLALMHDDENLTERETGKLITLQNMQSVMDALGKAMTGSMPEVGETQDDGKNAQSPQEK